MLQIVVRKPEDVSSPGAFKEDMRVAGVAFDRPPRSHKRVVGGLAKMDHEVDMKPR